MAILDLVSKLNVDDIPFASVAALGFLTVRMHLPPVSTLLKASCVLT